ncbi:MAG TPA: hypothetical protein VNH63_03125 [Gemmatimonadales bacterium]|nr:hypothetical protein [Gemmatimonadales bacterium]
MRTHVLTAVPATLAILALAACNDATTPLTQQDQVLAAARDQLGGMMDTTFGQSGVAATMSVTGGVMSVDSVSAPGFWGRLRVVAGGPRPVIHRDVTIQGDSAWVTQTVSYQGVFLVDTSADTMFNPSSKPLADGHTQSAVLVRDPARPRGWRVVAVTIQNWQNTDVSRRTVTVDSVAVYVNGVLKLTVTNPDSLYDVANRIPRLFVGDTVKIVAGVTNTTGGGLAPATFVFLHVRHMDVADVTWRRVRMKDNGDGTYQRAFIVRRTGADRFVVDALDAATLAFGTADNYRASEWGIPYRIE